MTADQSGPEEKRGSSPASRGAAGVYIEGELGAFYLLSMLAGVPARGLPSARVTRVRFQGLDLGYTLDDLVLHGVGPTGDVLLEVQSKRDVTFAPGDAAYREIAGQIARSTSDEVSEERHFLGIATQRTSRRISGAYQDVLAWAAAAESSDQFFKRLNARGVGNPEMRAFVATSRANLIASGVPDDDDAIWRILRRMLILEFDFEATAPMARTYGHMLARQVLADEDVGRAEGLWRTLIELSISTGTTGGALDRDTLRLKLVEAGYRLAGDREYGSARTKLADMARMALAAIGTTVAGVNLPRHEVAAALDEALQTRRFVELRGVPGVGKSSVLRHLAERISRQAPVIVLDPVATPAGGWVAFAHALGIPGSVNAFLTDLAASGGGIIFIDGLDMFVESGARRTVTELLQAASAVPGFRVVATSRANANVDAEAWPDDLTLAAFGDGQTIDVGDLTDDEVAILVEEAPRLRALLESSHPAARLSRNLYRLSRLLKLPGTTAIHSEGALADLWWRTGDGAAAADIRAAQRILAQLAARALEGGTVIELQVDSPARTYLLNALTLKEVRRDHLDVYHDVLRDWAIGSYINEDTTRLDFLDRSRPLSPRTARGIEFAARLALETRADATAWLRLLAQLSPAGAHGSWRRQAVLAIVRSEAAAELLEKCSDALLNDGGSLLVEVATTIAAADTVATADVMTAPGGARLSLPRSHRTNTSGTATVLLAWMLKHAAAIPLQALGAVAETVELQVGVLRSWPAFARRVADMLLGWLRQLDVHDAVVTIPGEKDLTRAASDAQRETVSKLRLMALLLCEFAPDALKGYLSEIAAEPDGYKIKELRPFSRAIARVAPAELSALILGSLVKEEGRRGRRDPLTDRSFSFADSDYLPASPAQPPFLDLLEAAPAEGLKLIRALVATAVAHRMECRAPGPDVFTLVFVDGPRVFPWSHSYLWSRDQSQDYSVGSALKALEAWAQKRLDDGEAIEPVLADILGPQGTCAAYLLVAVDVLLSHFPKTRDALAPFLGSPELLATDRLRFSHDVGRRDFGIGSEPPGKVTLADLAQRNSRRMTLETVLPSYVGDDPIADTLRAQLDAAVARLDPYEAESSWVDPRFMGRFARNVLQRSNWSTTSDGGQAYQSPPDEAAHLRRMEQRNAQRTPALEIEARIDLALEGGEYASAETARAAVEHAGGGLPDGQDTDALKSPSTRLIATALLVSRDGEDALLDEQEPWVRQVIALALAEPVERHGASRDRLRFNRPAIATLALLHLWARRGLAADRDALITVATRPDRCAAPAYAAALSRVLEVDPRLFKAALRAAFASLTWRRQMYDEGKAEQERFEAERTAAVDAAVTAEIAWLDGGPEPAWPEWPVEAPALRRPSRIVIPAEDGVSDTEAPEDPRRVRPTPLVHVDSQAASTWLDMLQSAPKGGFGWRQGVVDAYLKWTSVANGLGLPVDVELNEPPRKWNYQFYILFAERLLDAAATQFDLDLLYITELPDETFCEVAQGVIQAADALYFNDPQRAAVRPAELRSRLAERVMALDAWKDATDPASARVDRDIAGVAAKMLLNTYDPFSGTSSYLPAQLFDRVDPMLAPLRPLLGGGPTTFVAQCTMNLLLVAPRARHLDFVLEAAEIWFQRTQAFGLWLEAGVGRQVVQWFEQAIIEQPAILDASHALRAHVDRLFGRLVGLGIAEARELEKQVEAAAPAP